VVLAVVVMEMLHYQITARLELQILAAVAVVAAGLVLLDTTDKQAAAALSLSNT
jgi:hypothetical protein